MDSLLSDKVTQSATPPQGEVSTLDFVAEKLRRLREAESMPLDQMEAVHHKMLGVDFYVGPLSYDAHTMWMNVRRFEDLQHLDAKKSAEDPKDRKKSDLILLANSVHTGDGQLLGDENARMLLALQGAGPSNFALINTAEHLNPPREEMAREVAMMLSKSALDLVVMRGLIELGLGKMILDYTSTHSTPEEHALAAKTILQITEVVYALSPIFDAEDTAKRFGISLREGMDLVALYGSYEAAVKALNEPQE